MQTPTNRLATVLAVLTGAGAGVLVANMNGAASWLDAKLYIAIGAVAGAILAKVLLVIFK